MIGTPLLSEPAPFGRWRPAQPTFSKPSHTKKEDYTQKAKQKMSGLPGSKVSKPAMTLKSQTTAGVLMKLTLLNKLLLPVYQHEHEQGRRMKKKYSGSYMPILLSATKNLSKQTTNPFPMGTNFKGS